MTMNYLRLAVIVLLIIIADCYCCWWLSRRLGLAFTLSKRATVRA